VGTGLGLSISYKIIEAYRGLIEVKSEINKGTCFKISLPTPE
jgi:signal transduction histidine kinase